MTIKNAAYVRALGQIELVFTFAASCGRLTSASGGPSDIGGLIAHVADQP